MITGVRVLPAEEYTSVTRKACQPGCAAHPVNGLREARCGASSCMPAAAAHGQRKVSAAGIPSSHGEGPAGSEPGRQANSMAAKHAAAQTTGWIHPYAVTESRPSTRPSQTCRRPAVRTLCGNQYRELAATRRPGARWSASTFTHKDPGFLQDGLPFPRLKVCRRLPFCGRSNHQRQIGGCSMTPECVTSSKYQAMIPGCGHRPIGHTFDLERAKHLARWPARAPPGLLERSRSAGARSPAVARTSRFSIGQSEGSTRSRHDAERALPVTREPMATSDAVLGSGRETPDRRQ